MPNVHHRRPAAGDIFLSRPPYMLLAHVLSCHDAGDRVSLEYEIVDYEGEVLTRVRQEFDSSWWRDFQPLVRREG